MQTLSKKITSFARSASPRERFPRRSRWAAALLAGAFFLSHCTTDSSGGGDVDLALAIPLLAIPAPHPAAFTVPDDPNAEPGTIPAQAAEDETPLHSLFALAPGQFANMSRLAGTIDPVGTSLPQDFDGDGILNDNETNTNFWVADYPVIEASIATPVTMKIEILQSTRKANDEIVSEITSDDTENTRDKGSEQIHRTQVNLRTVQFEETFDKTNQTSIELALGKQKSRSTDTSGNFSGKGITVGGSHAESRSSASNVSVAWEQMNREAGTVTRWADRPFKDNLEHDSWNVKSNEAAKNARQFRKERGERIDSDSVVSANAGYVRAALYIENRSVNMPVRLTNILASLMLENGAGELIPVQSFFLRNEDYSPFEVDVYGGTEFGPYVIELANLNTAEIEHAISRGYSPKIFIADYDMSHVPDSNYRSALLNYSGENLKIVEENAKGRTALVKIFGPGIRKMYRVAAFTTDGSNPDICTGSQGTQAAPGVPLRTALERLACSGLDIEFDDYVYDHGEIAPDLAEYKMHVPGIKRIGSVRTTLPCVNETHTGSDSVSRTACVQKPYSQWTDEERENVGVWVVFSDGQYYAHNEYVQDGGVNRIFNTPTGGDVAIPMFQGVNNTAWAGDKFEIFFLSYRDLLIRAYGTDPFENNEPVLVDTLWNSLEIGSDGFDPDVNSVFLGKAGFGEKIELRVKLDQTAYLDPNFGTGTATAGATVYSDFNYNPRNISERFNLNEVADFEISLGFGGERSDWFHVVRDLDSMDTQKPSSCGTSLDFVEQEFYLCVQLPADHPYVDPDSSLINVFLRPALSTAYRESVWPLPFDEVRRFRALTRNAYVSGDTILQLDSAIGQLIPGDVLYFEGEPAGYTVTAATEAGGIYSVTLSSPLSEDVERSRVAYVIANVTEPNVELAVDNGFYTDWNTDAPSMPAAQDWRSAEKAPLLASDSHNCSLLDFNAIKCLGFNTDYVAGNWLGNNNGGVPMWNAWADAGDFLSYLSNGLPTVQATSGKTMTVRARAEDTLISSTNSGDQSGQRVVTSGNTSLTIWYDATTGKLYGRSVDLTTGQALGGGDFIINATTAVSTATASYDVAVSHSLATAVVVWFDGTTIYARRIVLSSGPLGTEFAVSDGPWSANRTPAVGIAGGKAVFAWQADNGPSYREIHGRILDVNTGLFDGANFRLSTYTDSRFISAGTPMVEANDDRAFVLWTVIRSDSNGDYNMIAGRIVDTVSGLPLGATDLPLSDTALDPNFSSAPQLSVSGNYAFAAWVKDNGHLYGRSVNLVSGNPVTAQEVAVANSYGFPSLAASGTRAVAVRRVSTLVNATVFDMLTGQSLGSVTVSATAPGVASSAHAVTAAAGRALIVWDSNQSGNLDIYGTILDLNTVSIVDSAGFLINAADFNDQRVPRLSITGNQGLVAWESNDNGIDFDVRGRVVDIQQRFPVPYGLNNFFTAPLVRRLYEVRAGIKIDP